MGGKGGGRRGGGEGGEEGGGEGGGEERGDKKREEGGMVVKREDHLHFTLTLLQVGIGGEKEKVKCERVKIKRVGQTELVQLLWSPSFSLSNHLSIPG